MSPGPIPVKAEERRRRNKDAVETEVVNLDETLAGEVEVPKVDESWHPIAIEIFEAQKKSGQSIWMEPSDWAMLYLMCESISRDLNPQVVGINEETGKAIMAAIPLKGASLSAYLKGFASLLVSEGERRRLRLELERKKRIDAAAAGENVVDIVQRRQDAFKGS